LEYLNTEYARKITSHDIEEISGSNFDYINRIFKKMTHKTIFTYLNSVRINHAMELITTTNMKMSEVGQSVGFTDLYYFSKVFKKAVGVSPSNYNREG
jgi:YesN/AraC family two-component response regulator